MNELEQEQMKDEEKRIEALEEERAEALEEERAEALEEERAEELAEQKYRDEQDRRFMVHWLTQADPDTDYEDWRLDELQGVWQQDLVKDCE